MAAVTLDETLTHQLDALDCAKLKGVRCNLQEQPPKLLTLQVIQAMDLLSRRNLTFDVCVRAEQLSEVVQLARSCPRTQFILDHCGKPTSSTLATWRQDITQLATLKNTACKLSGLTSQEDLTSEQMDLCLVHVLTHFGCDRVLFGSDYPLVDLWSNWARRVHEALDSVGWWSREERDRVFFQNARRLYRLEPTLTSAL